MSLFEDKITREKMNALQADIEALKAHRAHCDELHEAHKEHKKRSDDSMNNLTESNMTLAKSITDMNLTLTKVVGIIDRDAPDIKFVNKTRNWGHVSWVIFITLVAAAAGWSSLKGFF